MNSHKIRFLVLFSLIILGLFTLLMLVFLSHIYDKSKKPTLKIVKTEYPSRGEIYSNDGFKLATSEKLYKVSINPKSIDPEKKELFVNLVSIYTGIPKETIFNKLKTQKYTTISYNISTITAANLKLLNSKLDRFRVFREYEEYGRVIQKMGIDIEVSGYSRKYPYGDIMEPLLGYTQKTQNRKMTQVFGVKGSEKNHDSYLQAKNEGKIIGNRDIHFNLIRNKNFSMVEKKDGFNLTLTLPLAFQKKVEIIIDQANKKLKAKEILVGVMDSKTGKILALATSKRFNPKNIKKDEYASLNLSATELSFEPGSIIKPVIYAILLQKNLIPENQEIFLHNGVYKIGRHTIRDDHPLKSATPPEILENSSNIGMIKLTQNLNSQDFLSSLKAYGFGAKTSIDLSQEAEGVLPDLQKLKGSYKASVSYGYGFRATFMQILRAYASFSNGGYLVTPQIVDFISNDKERYKLKLPPNTQIISSQNALELQKILKEIVKKGTGKKAYIENIDLGGKTGTARIFIDGKYTKRYNSSFFGFAKDSKKSYTIGVVAFDPNVDEGGYYGSKTAAPIFREIVELLISENRLKPTLLHHSSKEAQQ